MESTNTLDCSGFQKEASPSGVIEGKFFCQGSEPGQSNSSSPNNPPSAHSRLSTGAKIGIGVALPLVAIMVASIVFVWKKGYKLSLQRTGKTQPVGPPHPREAELPLGSHYEKTELPVKEKPGELSGISAGPVQEAYELYASERY